MTPLLLLAFWFTYTLTDSTGAVVQQGERGPYDSDIACHHRREAFIAMQRPRVDARDPKKIKTLPPLSMELSDCVPDRVDRMPR